MFSNAAIAAAGVDHWFSGTLVAGKGYASASAHSMVYIQATGNHSNLCIDEDQGYAGYFNASDNAWFLCSNSPNATVSESLSLPCCWHALVANINASTPTIVATSTHYSW